MKKYIDSILQSHKSLSLKEQLQLKTETLIRLVEKLDEASIEVSPFEQELEELTDLLEDIVNGEKHLKARFKRGLRKFAYKMQKSYGLVEKSWYQTLYTGIGLSLGMSMGIVLIKDTSSGVALGISLGLAIGVGLGIQQDKAALRNNKVY